MACNCKKDIEKRVTDRYAQDLIDSKDVSASLTGYAFTFDAGVSMKPYMPIEVSHTKSSKAGVDRKRTEKVSMFFNFCPFCGVSLKPATPKEPAA